MRSMSIGIEPIAVTSLYPTPQTVSDGSFAQSLQDTVDVGATGFEQSAQSAPQQPAQEEAPQALQKPEAQPQTELHNEKSEQTAAVPEAKTQTAEADGPDPDLMKELADLLAKKEEMLTAPERMRKTLENMIVQALSELDDPEIKEEEFTEMVLDFLMEFIDRKFGGETEDTSIFTENSDKDEDENVQDVLLQAVVQMLDNIRSENEDTATAEEAPEDVQAAEEVPHTEMAREYAAETASELLSEETKQMVELDSFIEAPQSVAETQPETDGDLQQAQQTEEIPQAETPKADAELYQAAAQAAESIYSAITQPQPVQQTQPQPVKAERSREVTAISTVQPAEELEELTRLVKGGESIKPEQPETDLNGEQRETAKAETVKPTVTLGVTGETVPFEAAIASTVPQITLTRTVEGSGAEQIVTQIVSEIFNQLPEEGGTTTFVMTLNPESLGKVTVKLVEEAGKISVSVTAHERRTAEILSQRFDTLQTAMKENGTQLEKYQVVYAPEKDEGAAHQNFDGSSKNPYVKQDDEESEDNGEFAEFLQQAV